MDRIRAALFDHRRAVAAALTVLAVLAAIRSVQPDDTGVATLVAARDLDSGHVLVAGDLTVVDVPPASRPDEVLDRGEAVGRRVAGPVRAREPLTDRRVVDPRDLSGHGPDATLSMVRLDDPSAVSGLRVGDVVDVVATPVDDRTARVVAAGATVALLPPPDDRSGGVVSIGVVTDREAGLALAAAGLDSRLGVLVSS